MTTDNTGLYRNEKIVGKEPWRSWDCPAELKKVFRRWQGIAYRRLRTYEQLWYSKGVSTEFDYKGRKYELYPSTFNIPAEFMETLQDGIADDLKRVGCLNINSYGMID